MRSLNEGDRALREIAECAVEDLRPRHLIGVENQQELAIGLQQSVVEIAGLCVQRPVLPAGASRDVADAEFVGHLLHGWAVAIVEHISAMRVTDALGRLSSAANELDLFVVRRDEDVNGQTGGRRRRRRARLRSPQREPEEEHIDERVGLGKHQRNRDPPGVEFESSTSPLGSTRVSSAVTADHHHCHVVGGHPPGTSPHRVGDFC